jgi:hypothetical protein
MWLLQFLRSCPYWPLVSQLTQRCYAMAYNGGSSAPHTSTRGDYLTTALDLDWSDCLQTPSRLSLDSQLTNSLVFEFSRHTHCTDPTENIVPLLIWVMYSVFHCSGTVCLVLDCVATLLPTVLLLLHHVTTIEGRCVYWAIALQWPLCWLNYLAFSGHVTIFFKDLLL